MNSSIDSILKDLLLYNVEFRSRNNNKCLRKGTIQLYCIKDFFINFIIKTHKGDNKNYVMPYPFETLQREDRVVLDYRLKIIHNGQQHIIDTLADIGESRSPFYDNVIEIVKV